MEVTANHILNLHCCPHWRCAFLRHTVSGAIAWLPPSDSAWQLEELADGWCIRNDRTALWTANLFSYRFLHDADAGYLMLMTDDVLLKLGTFLSDCSTASLACELDRFQGEVRVAWFKNGWCGCHAWLSIQDLHTMAGVHQGNYSVSKWIQSSWMRWTKWWRGLGFSAAHFRQAGTWPTDHVWQGKSRRSLVLAILACCDSVRRSSRARVHLH